MFRTVCSHKVVAVGFNTLRYDASVGVLNPPHESNLKIQQVFLSYPLLVDSYHVKNKGIFEGCILNSVIAACGSAVARIHIHMED